MLDLILLLVFLAVVVIAAAKGFFVTALQLGAWIISVVTAGALSSALAAPVYAAFAARPIRNLIETKIDGALSGSQAAQAAREVIEGLPDAVTQLAARFGGISAQSLIAGIDAKKYSAASAAQMLEESIAAPIVTAVIRVALSLVVFALLLLVTRWVAGKIAKIRKLPVLKQADKLLGVVLGLVKGALLLFVLALALRAAAALSPESSDFAQAVESSRIVSFMNWSTV